jgi:hypothetical protein
VSGAAVSDDPPLSLEWSLGQEMPYGQKDGAGCLIGSEFVTQGGGWVNVTVRGVPPPKLPKDSPCLVFTAIHLRYAASHLAARP